MSTDAGAVAPYIEGKVVQPSAVTSAESNLGHQFFNVVRHLISHATGAYHDETTQKDHLNVVNRYEATLLGGDRRFLVSESDAAPHEDVSQRVPPAGQNVQAVPQPAYAPIDYNQLAAAMLAQQQAAQVEQTLEGK